MKKMFLSAVLLLSAAAQTVWADTVFSCKTDNNKYIEVQKNQPQSLRIFVRQCGKKRNCHTQQQS